MQQFIHRVDMSFTAIFTQLTIKFMLRTESKKRQGTRTTEEQI